MSVAERARQQGVDIHTLSLTLAQAISIFHGPPVWAIPPYRFTSSEYIKACVSVDGHLVPYIDIHADLSRYELLLTGERLEDQTEYWPYIFSTEWARALFGGSQVPWYCSHCAGGIGSTRDAVVPGRTLLLAPVRCPHCYTRWPRLILGSDHSSIQCDRCSEGLPFYRPDPGSSLGRGGMQIGDALVLIPGRLEGIEADPIPYTHAQLEVSTGQPHIRIDAQPPDWEYLYNVLSSQLGSETARAMLDQYQPKHMPVKEPTCSRALELRARDDD